MLRNGVSPGSRAGLQAWIVSCLFHSLLLALVIPLFQHMPQITPEPFQVTISLIEPFESPSEGLSTPLRGPDHPMAAALPSEGPPIGPPRPSMTTSRADESLPLKAAVHERALPLAEIAETTITSESHAIAVPQSASTGLSNRHFLQTPAPALRQHTAPVVEMARNSEPPAAFAEPVRAQVIATEQQPQQADEPMLHPPSRSSGRDFVYSGGYSIRGCGAGNSAGFRNRCDIGCRCSAYCGHSKRG